MYRVTSYDLFDVLELSLRAPTFEYNALEIEQRNFFTLIVSCCFGRQILLMSQFMFVIGVSVMSIARVEASTSQRV